MTGCEGHVEWPKHLRLWTYWSAKEAGVTPVQWLLNLISRDMLQRGGGIRNPGYIKFLEDRRQGRL